MPGDAEEAEELVQFVAVSEQSQRLDWLHRGAREPLASMGFYHYSMFVYTAHVMAETVPGDDFEVYLFADTHPSAAFRVQKLRLDQACKVPRLSGFTMPQF